MRHIMIAMISGLVTLAITPAWAQNQPGQIRTSTGVPMRTGFGQSPQTTAGNLFGVIPGSGQTHHGSSFPAYITTGTSININGDGFSIGLNGSLAQQLGFNTYSGNTFGSGSYGSGHYGSGTCVSVPDANSVLINLPQNVRDLTTVLYGVDYGWSYDVICLPSSYGHGGAYGGRGYSGFGYGWSPPGNTYYLNGYPAPTQTAGWGTLGQPNMTAPPPPAQPVEPPTAIELARFALATGELEAAEQQYREHIKEHTDDSQALREFALTMFELERPDEGFAAIRKAYRDQPELAAMPLDLRRFGFDGSRTRKLMGKVSPTANRLETSSAWLALAVLLQGQDKDRAAARMIDKAEAAGLDPEIVSRFRTKFKS